ncbi:MAG: type II secretion system secretin GspD [Marinobacterium sp.]|nr:type II secretion system secretin GspD [Marinobacterium sp.]
MKQMYPRYALLLATLLLSACSSEPTRISAPVTLHQPVGALIQQRRDSQPVTASPHHQQAASVATNPDSVAHTPKFELISAGQIPINQQQARKPRPMDKGGEITLNFQQADINEISRTILGDILQRNYTIDERVSGTFSLHTSRPVSPDALIPILESMLEANGALLHDNGALIEIVPQSQHLLAHSAPRLQLDARRGWQTLVVPLRYIAASEMARILDGTRSENNGEVRRGRVQVDEKRNLLLLSGSHQLLAGQLDTVDIFDVDQLKGMAVGMMALETVSTATMLKELQAVFGDGANGPLAGMVQFVPISRLNSLLIITPQRRYLDAARGWIERLDRSNHAHHSALHIYKVRHSTAEHLAELLGQLFNHKELSDNRHSIRPTTSGSGPLSPSAERTAEATTITTNMTERPEGTTDSGLSVRQAALPDENTALPDGNKVSIIADKQNNALLIMASDSDYQRIKLALNKLDVLPMQVLVEASIVEVTLSDDLFYGLEWFFKNGLSNNRTGRGQLDLNSPGLAPASPGFSYSVVDSANAVRAVFNTLASDNKVNVVSSPSLMVLDNQAASIRVGDQVPIRTSETTNTGSSGNDPLVTSTIQFRDTGVMLEVTPQIRDGGMVVLKINQDVSDVAQTTSSGIDSPTINQRQINTTVAVHSGDTIVLGGLIRDNQDRNNSGVPGLRNVPGLGWAFGETRKKHRRTELVVLITPTAITNRNEAQEVTREFRNHLKGLKLPSAFKKES